MDEEIFAAEGAEGRLNAIIDSGATASIMSLATAEKLSHHVKNIDPTVKRKFRTASNNVLTSLSMATMEIPNFGEVAFHICEGAIPTLIGMTTLANASVDFRKGILEVRGEAFDLQRNPSGHLVVPLN